MTKYTIIILASVILSGCSQAWYNARKDRKLEALAVERKSTFLDISNRLNPCFQGKAKSDTVTIMGKLDTSISWSTTKTPMPYITVGPEFSITQGMPCKPDTIIKTVRITKPVTTLVHDTIPDMRGIATLNDKLGSAKEDLIKSQQQLADKTSDDSKYHLLFYGLLCVIILYLGIKVYGLISGGFLKKVI